MIMKTAEQPARERLGTLCTPHEVKNLTPLNNSLLIFFINSTNIYEYLQHARPCSLERSLSRY